MYDSGDTQHGLDGFGRGKKRLDPLVLFGFAAGLLALIGLSLSPVLKWLFR